jgi:microcystin-dependent protein
MSFTDGFTTNLHLTKPADGGSDDTWGQKTNANWDTVDGLFASTGSGTIVRRDATGAVDAGPGINIKGANTVARIIQWFTGTGTATLRWLMGVDTTNEAGSNAGSNFAFSRYDDLGNVIDQPINIARSTGVVKFSQAPTVGANTIVHQGNLGSLAGAYVEPVGTIKMYVGTSDPPAVAAPAGDGIQHYLLCDGRSLVGTAFPALFAIIGTQYGGTGGNFNLPNTAERVIIGKSAARTLIPQYDATAMGNSFGEGNHALVTGELAAHTHTVDTTHTHAFTYQQTNNNPGTGAAGVCARLSASGDNTPFTVPSGGNAAAPSSSAGSGTGHNNVQPALVAQFIIRVI